MKRKYVWLSKDCYGDYEIWENNPNWDGMFFDGLLIVSDFCSEVFESLTNIKLKEGECVKIELPIKFKMKGDKNE